MTPTPSRDEMLALQEWIREPDFAEEFSLADMADWMNRRPLSVVLRLAVSASGGVQGRIPDGQQCNEQSAQGLSLATDPDLLALIERAKSNVMTPEEHYEQRRSFVRGMCPSKRDYAEWCAEVDKLLPPLDSGLSTDATSTRSPSLHRESLSDPTSQPPESGAR